MKTRILLLEFTIDMDNVYTTDLKLIRVDIYIYIYILPTLHRSLHSHLLYHTEVLYRLHTTENQNENYSPFQRNSQCCGYRIVFRQICKTLCQTSDQQKENNSKTHSIQYLTRNPVAGQPAILLQVLWKI